MHHNDDAEMDRMTDVLTVDVSEHAPFLPGEHFIEMNSERARADIIDTRYLSQVRAGRRLVASFGDDLGLLINDSLWAATSPFEATYRGNGVYILSLRLSGNCVESVNRTSHPLGAFTCSLIHYAQGVKHVFRMLPGEPLVEVCAVFRPSLFMKKYNMTASAAESFLNPPHCRNLDPWFSRCRMTPRMEAVVHELRGASPFGKTWRLFAEAKTLELISLYVDELENTVTGQNKPPATVNDLQRLYVVRGYLGRHYRRSPRIDDLCRLAGLNRRKLTEGFKAEFGRTVYEYIQYLRMEQARALFQNGFTDIRRVAEHVGYGHQGNFAKAFKQYLGISPRQFTSAQRGMHKTPKVPIASIS